MHVINSAIDPHPGSTEEWIADVVCEHGKLQPDVKKRRRISSEASAILESLFPDWTPISHRTKVCGVCDNEHESNLQSLAEFKELAKKEKVIPVSTVRADSAVADFDFSGHFQIIRQSNSTE